LLAAERRPLALKLMIRMQSGGRRDWPPAYRIPRRAGRGRYAAPMHPCPDIRVAVMAPRPWDAAGALRVAPAQEAFIGDVALNLADAAADPDSDAMAILGDGAVIGCYRLDYRPTVVTRRSVGRRAVVLRAFLLDAGWQGRGLATTALAECCADLARRHPERRLLALNVDCVNVVAVRAYRHAGFVDTGELCRGGRAGPQRLMLRQLGAARHVATMGRGRIEP
jgi:RimJ/RimL family protein N-acetyltransferase